MSKKSNHKIIKATGNTNLGANIIIIITRAMPLAIFISVFMLVGMSHGYTLGVIAKSDFILFVAVTSCTFFCFILTLLFFYFNENSEKPWRIWK